MHRIKQVANNTNLVVDEELKYYKKHYQGKYFRQGDRYYRFIRITRANRFDFKVDAKVVDTIHHIIYPDYVMLVSINAFVTFTRITKSEYNSKCDPSYKVFHTLSDEMRDQMNKAYIKMANYMDKWWHPYYTTDTHTTFEYSFYGENNSIYQRGTESLH